jgi:hypothetical protein
MTQSKIDPEMTRNAEERMKRSQILVIGSAGGPGSGWRVW